MYLSDFILLLLLTTKKLSKFFLNVHTIFVYYWGENLETLIVNFLDTL